MKFIEREIRYPDGSFETIKVSVSRVEKEISRLIKRDKEMLDILAKL